METGLGGDLSWRKKESLGYSQEGRISERQVRAKRKSQGTENLPPTRGALCSELVGPIASLHRQAMVSASSTEGLQ